MRSSSASAALGGQHRRAQVALERGRRARRPAGSRPARARASAASRSPRTAGTTNTPTGRSTRSTGGQLLVGERQPRGRGDPPAAQVARRRTRRGARAPSARGRRPARRRAPSRRGERAALVVAVRPDRRGRRGRSAAGRGRAAARSSSCARRGGEPRPVQAGVAVGARLAVDQRPTAAIVSRVLSRPVMPWRRSTICACASRLRQLSGSLGSTGSLAASRVERPPAEVLERRAALGQQRSSCAAASVSRACSISRVRSSCSEVEAAQRRSKVDDRPGTVGSAAASTAAVGEGSMH